MFKKGMMLYTKAVDDPEQGKVTVTARVFKHKVTQITYGNLFMTVPDEYKQLIGQKSEAMKTQGFVLERVVLEDDGLPEEVDPGEVDFFENSDILDRPSVTVELNWKFFDEIAAVERAKNDEDRYNAFAALGEAVYYMSLGEDAEE